VNRYCAVAFTALFFCVQGNAQVPLAFQEGSIFTSSYHGADVDKVNLTNGALSLRIPIYSLPEKGDLKLSYSLVFNSNNLVRSLLAIQMTRIPSTLKQPVRNTPSLEIRSVRGSSLIKHSNWTR